MNQLTTHRIVMVAIMTGYVIATAFMGSGIAFWCMAFGLSSQASTAIALLAWGAVTLPLLDWVKCRWE